MYFRPLFTAFFVLLFGFQAIGATIGVRPMRISRPDDTLRATTETIQPPPIHDSASAAALPPRSEHEYHDARVRLHETTIDWREDGPESLRLESEREAGFLPSSYEESEYPSLQLWPLLKICVVSAIAMCVLKIVRDLKKQQ